MTSNIAQGRERVCIEQTGITRMRLTSGYTPIGHDGDKCNHTRTNPWGTQSMAKPKSREASIDIKHISKQTYICIQENEPNPLIQASMCGCRPRPWDLNLHPTNKGQNTRKRDIKGQKGYRSTRHQQPTYRSKHTNMAQSI